MRIIFDVQKERRKFLVMAILLAGCCFLTYYFHTAISTGKFATHFYYIPIILAALWWKRKGLAVAIFFAAWLIFSHFFIRSGEETIYDFLRAALFVTVGFITVILREQIDKEQKEIKREKKFSENIITSVPDSLIVVDKALRIKKGNLSFCQVFGIKPENVEGARITDLLGDEDGKLSAELTRLIGTKTTIENLEINYRSEKLGERVLHIAARGIIVASEEEEEEEVLIVLGDITHRKQMEESLRKAYDEMERRVKERTAELKNANEQLKQEIEDRKQAEEAKRIAEQELEKQRLISMRADRLPSLGEMAAGIAHELNQPLSGVRGLSEHLLIGMDRGWDLSKEKTREKLKLVIEQADRMTNIIEHVGMFAREAGRPEVRPVNVNDVVSSAMDMLGAQFKAHGLDLDCELADGLPLVSANPFSLEEVALNLMTNARDAMEERLKTDPDSPSEILLRTRMDRKARERPVKIQVIDRGAGIPPEVLPKVFDPFFTTKGPHKGTGLGLSICKSIVEGFGGAIEIDSTPGQGATVTVSLPAEAPK